MRREEEETDQEVGRGTGYSGRAARMSDTQPTESGRTPATGEHFAETLKPSSTGSSPTRSAGVGIGAPPEVTGAPSNARFGKFIRTLRLGAGGMGEVWKAWDTQLSRWVALKFLKGGDEDEILRFKREAQTAGQLSHPNIAAVYEVGEDHGRHYIAMQFVDGQTLKTYPRNDRMALARLMRDATRAVVYAHEQGIVHRDLKPENLMVTQRGREPHLYVMDFGLARAIEGGTQLSISGSVVGTPSYMPPEQARGERVDARADVYSLGAAFYELLTDRVPFKGANVYETLRRVQEEEPTAPRKVDPKIDSDLETITLKCLEKEMLRRYATSKELAEDIDRFLEGEPIAAKRTSIVYRWRRKLAKRKAVVLTVMGALAVVGGVLAVLVPKLLDQNARYREAQKQLLLQMRTTANACLETSLELRRVGRNEMMPKYAVKSEEACREVADKIPSLAEPHFRLGRMYRAQMRDAEGEKEQEAALAKDDTFAPCWYEKAVMAIRKYRRRIMELAAEGQPPDAQALAFKASAVEAIAKLDKTLPAWKPWPEEARFEALLPSEQASLRGMKAWLAGRPETEFEKDASKKTPVPEEAYEVLVIAALEQGRFEEAVQSWIKALGWDKGYAPHHRDLGATRLLAAKARETIGHDAVELYREAVKDGETAVKIEKGDALSWEVKGRAGAKLAAKTAPGDARKKIAATAVGDLAEAMKLAPARAAALRSIQEEAGKLAE